MQAFVTFLNSSLAVLTVLANLLAVALIVAIFNKKFRASALAKFTEKKALWLAFIVSLVAALGSLAYSDVIGYEPCKLCWFQRIFMYPQVLILGIAAYRNDLSAKIYAIALSSIGAVIALFHYIGQLGWNPFALECLAIGYSTSCAQNFVLRFGYITIPLMAFSAFILIILILCTKTSRHSELSSS